MADEAGDAPAPVEEVEMSVLDALKEVSGTLRALILLPLLLRHHGNVISLSLYCSNLPF